MPAFPSYASYRTHFTFTDIYQMLRHEVDEGKRHHITRHTVLGKWHEIKLRMYKNEMEQYESYIEYAR